MPDSFGPGRSPKYGWAKSSSDVIEKSGLSVADLDVTLTWMGEVFAWEVPGSSRRGRLGEEGASTGIGPGMFSGFANIALLGE